MYLLLTILTVIFTKSTSFPPFIHIEFDTVRHLFLTARNAESPAGTFDLQTYYTEKNYNAIYSKIL